MKKISILIVDDNEVDRYILKRQIESAGFDFNVFEKSDGKEALEFFESYEQQKLLFPEDYPPLLIFLDINMPRVDGLEFLKDFSDIRKEKDLQASVILMITSSSRPDEKETSMSYDFVHAYILKEECNESLIKENIAGLV
ncbi:response regulator [Reinekea thalattae]|uniref:Response regulator n=1 Tax=Reinekea thalattae TaxID=2593301 RepID=A0A5C8ZBQ7_9GAMM|nr:response regulator [Reinekea thalattae]TXR54628.1 response regulator [Reinekea thalattae]